MPATYTVKQVADILGYSTNSIYTFLKEKRIKGVRVGKGRFRIPRTELDRLLEISGSRKVLPDAVRTETHVHPVKKTTLKPLDAREDFARRGFEEHHSISHISPHRITYPYGQHRRYPQEGNAPQYVYRLKGNGFAERISDLFEWFTGMSAIVLGVTMIFFRGTFEEFNVHQYSVWTPAITSVFIGAGIGLLVTGVSLRVARMWRILFRFMLAISFGLLAWILWAIGDAEGSITYWIVALLIILKMFVRLGGLLSFALLGAGVISGLPVAMIIMPSDIVKATFPWLLTVDRVTATAVWTLASSTVFLLIIFGYVKERILFWACTLCTSIALGGLSLLYGHALFWGRSFVFLVIALMGLFIPVWDRFINGIHEDRKILYSAFVGLLALFLVAIGVVRIVETGMVGYTQNELTGKVAFAQTTVEGVLDSVQSSMENGAANHELVTALEKGKDEDVLAVIRTMFETRGNVRRIAVVTSDGVMTAVYPHEPTFSQTSYALREFVTAPITSHTYYISDYIVDGVDKGSVIVSMPIISMEGESIGVLAGWLDLSALGTKLQQLAVAKNGEHVRMIDKTGRYMVHPDTSLLSRQSEVSDGVRYALSRGKGVIEEYDPGGQRMITAYGIIPTRQWGIALSMPLSSVTRQTHVPLILVGSISAITICIVLLLSMRHGYSHSLEDGP